MTDAITQASNVANVIVAFANIVLVLFLFWQISLQKRFFLDQSRRDAALKVSESYQRLTATFLGNKDLAALFYQTHDPARGQMRAIWAYVLNTLQQEYRFAKQGLHPMDNLMRTAQEYIGFITDKQLLAEIAGQLLKAGFDADFTRLMEEMVKERLGQLSYEH